MAAVYMITCKTNGKRYVGMTSRTVTERWHGHMQAARKGSKQAICRAIAKHGAEAFEVRELAGDMNVERALWLEAEMIAQLETLSPAGYNLTTGGEAFRHLPDSKPKMSEASKAYWATPGAKERHAATMKARYEDPEERARTGARTARDWQDPAHRAARSAAIAAAQSTPEARAKSAAATTEQWQDPEIRARRIAGLTGRKFSAVARANISAALTGKKRSIEVRQRMSEVRKAQMDTSALGRHNQEKTARKLVRQAEAAKMRAEGLKLAEIADRMGVTPGAVYNYLKAVRKEGANAT